MKARFASGKLPALTRLRVLKQITSPSPWILDRRQGCRDIIEKSSKMVPWGAPFISRAQSEKIV